MSYWRILYWLLVGALLGIGVISIFSIGIFLLAAGLILLIFGAIRFGGRGLLAAMVGFGVGPALVLLWDVTSMAWACQPADGVTSSPVVYSGQTYTSPNYYSCVNTFIGPLTSYHVLAAGFGAVALIVVLIGVVTLVLRGPRRGGDGHPAA
jgi:cytochrome bd-type quinol oxidase subunit 1